MAVTSLQAEAADPSAAQGLVSLGVAALAVAVACAISHPSQQVHTSDGAYYAYLAELCARGLLPYRDVFHIQGPLLVWLGGGSAWLGGAIGLLIQGAVISGLMTFGACLLAIGAQRNRRVVQILPVALVAWGVSTGWPFIGDFIVSGSRPKFLSIALCALAIHFMCGETRQRSKFASGVAFAAACWSWQPAALIAIGALAGWSLVRWRSGPTSLQREAAIALALLAGVLLFSAGMVATLIAQSSLDSFVSQAVMFSRGDFGRAPTPHHLFLLLPMPVMVVGGAGLVAFIVSILPRLPESKAAVSLPARAKEIRGAAFGWLVVYFALISIDLDYRGDTVPLLLPLSVFAGALMSRVGEKGAGWGRIVLSVLLTFWLTGGDLLSPIHHSSDPYNPGAQIRPNAHYDVLEAAQDRGVAVFADPQLAQRLGENPKHPYVYWEPNILLFIEQNEAGGVDGFLDRLVAHRYGVVTLGPRAGELLPYLMPKLNGLYDARRLRNKAYSFVLRQR